MMISGAKCRPLNSAGLSRPMNAQGYQICPRNVCNTARFSGRPAPPRPGADAITREAYSHEVISAGFWPGNGGFGAPAFYCYAAPEPAGLSKQQIGPVEAFYSSELKEFILKYDDARAANSPDE